MECISESSADSEDEIKPLRHTKRQRKISESSSTSESDQVAKPNTRKPEIHAGNNSYQASRKRCKARTRTRSRSRPGSVSGSQSDQSNSGGVGNESTFKTPNCRRSSRKAAIAAKASLAQSQSLEELDDGDNIDKNVVTPVSEGMKVHMNSSSNPRSSSRLRLSHDKKGSMKLPDRKKVLEAISPCTSSMKRAQQYQPKKLVNNFIKEKSSYNRDITYDSDEEDVDDFINDDDDDDDDDEEGVAESPSTSSPDIPESESDSERDSEASLKSQSRLKSTNNLISRPKSKGVLSSSENESDAGGKKHDQKNSMKIRRKCGIKRKKIDTDNSSTDNDTDEEINNSQHRIHKANILRDDDSCDDRSDYELTKFQNSTNSQLLSRKSSRAERLKKQQLEDKERKFLALKRKRELAKLPLDKRKEAEEKIKQEELSECISADEETPGATFIEIFADAFCENELDKNFVVSGTDSEDELLNAKKRKDFDAFLQSLARSDIEKEPDREGESVSPGNEKPENRIENGKDRADQSSFTPKLKRKDAGRYRKVMILSDSEDDSEVKIEPSVKKLFSLVQNETSIGSVKDTLKQNDIPINSKGEKGRTVLHLVSIKGNLELLEFFLQHNALPNVYDDYGLLPICYAALWKNVKCLKALLPVSDLSGMQRSLHKYMEGMSFLHVITLNGPKTDTDEEEDIKVECLQIVKDFNKKMYESMLSKVDSRGYSPIVAAISDGHVKMRKFDKRPEKDTIDLSHVFKFLPGVFLNKTNQCTLTVKKFRYRFECLQQFIDDRADYKSYQTDYGGNILHFLVENAENCLAEDEAACLRVVLPNVLEKINDSDIKGFTPLMYASEMANADCIKALLEYGASLKCKDDQGTTSLHLAAASGDTQCVELLLSHGHQVDCLDNCGWPPLLYANFKACESCVIALMKANPQQLFILANLLRTDDEIQKMKNMEVVKSTILSLANQDAYYTIFNDFIRQNPSLLDEYNYGLFMHTWKAILDFDNKYSWFKRKLRGQRCGRSCPHVLVNRERVLESAMHSLRYTNTFCIEDFHVTFENEPGQCTGPKREFLSCFCSDVIKPERKLLRITDDRQFSPVPNGYFSKFLGNPSTSNGLESRPDAVDDGTRAMLSSRAELQGKLEELQFIGKLVAACIADGWYLQLQLAKSFIKHILKMPLNHPDDLQSFDNMLYKNAVEWVLENPVNDICLPFSHSEASPWNNSLVEIPLGDEKFQASMLTDANKEEFVKRISKFKLETSIQKEIQAFKTGFYEEINPDLIGLFNADEFSLILNGVQNINVNDWKKHTKYSMWRISDNVIIWFWETLEKFKEEEKALLLKFSTGTPCVPVGGFKALTGLGATHGFTIGKSCGTNKIPCAQTCFNLLQLTDYDSEKELREKLLIAIRHGSEGFSFG